MYPCANLVSCNYTSDKKTKYNKIKRAVQSLFLNKFRISITQENCFCLETKKKNENKNINIACNHLYYHTVKCSWTSHISQNEVHESSGTFIIYML